MLACTEFSSSRVWDLSASSARTSRLGDEPKAGGGWMLTIKNPARDVRAVNGENWVVKWAIKRSKRVK